MASMRNLPNSSTSESDEGRGVHGTFRMRQDEGTLDINRAKEICSKFKLGGIFQLWYFEIDCQYAPAGGIDIHMQATVPHRDTGRPFQIHSMSRYYAPFSKANEEFFNEFLANAARMMVEHEFWESFRYDGKLFKDPHSGDRR